MKFEIPDNKKIKKAIPNPKKIKKLIYQYLKDEQN